MSKKFRILADGFLGKVRNGTNAIRFLACKNIPVGYTVIYSHIVVDVQPHKVCTIIVRLTVEGNIIKYRGKVTTKTADLTTFTIHINSVIFTRGARYAWWDIENYYLKTPMGWSEYLY